MRKVSKLKSSHCFREKIRNKKKMTKKTKAIFKFVELNQFLKSNEILKMKKKTIIQKMIMGKIATVEAMEVTVMAVKKKMKIKRISKLFISITISETQELKILNSTLSINLLNLGLNKLMMDFMVCFQKLGSIMSLFK